MFASESVTEDIRIRFAIRSTARSWTISGRDPYARNECAISTSILFIAARFASEVKADIPTLARKVISRIGYRRPDFEAQTCSVLTSLQEYPPSADLYFNENH
jgi:S-adenosylmethionine synthetase